MCIRDRVFTLRRHARFEFLVHRTGDARGTLGEVGMSWHGCSLRAPAGVRQVPHGNIPCYAAGSRPTAKNRGCPVRIRSSWLCVLLAAPLSMTVELPDSSMTEPTPGDYTTSYRIGGGGGRYYHTLGFSDCGTSVPVRQEFVDVGAEFDRQTGKTSHFGLRAGYIHDTTDTLTDVSQFENTYGAHVDLTHDVYYGNVYGAREFEYVGVGLGVLVTSDPLNIHNPQDPTDNDVHLYPTAHPV